MMEFFISVTLIWRERKKCVGALTEASSNFPDKIHSKFYEKENYIETEMKWNVNKIETNFSSVIIKDREKSDGKHPYFVECTYICKLLNTNVFFVVVIDLVWELCRHAELKLYEKFHFHFRKPITIIELIIFNEFFHWTNVPKKKQMFHFSNWAHILKQFPRQKLSKYCVNVMCVHIFCFAIKTEHISTIVFQAFHKICLHKLRKWACFWLYSFKNLSAFHFNESGGLILDE